MADDDFTPARRLFMRAEYDSREGLLPADAIARRLDAIAPVTDAVNTLAGLPRLPDGAHVLDLGTGAGAFAFAAARAHPGLRVTGVDVSPGAVDAATRAAEALGLAERVTFRVADFEADALPHADAILVAYALSLADDPGHVVARTRRVLPDGGRLVVFDGVLPRRVEPGALDERRLDAMAEDAGYRRVGRVALTDAVRAIAARGEWPWATAPVEDVRFLASAYARA